MSIKNLFEIIEEHPNLSLKTIGFLTLVYRNKEAYKFNSFETFLKWFRIDVIDFEVITTELKQANIAIVYREENQELIAFGKQKIQYPVVFNAQKQNENKIVNFLSTKDHEFFSKIIDLYLEYCNKTGEDSNLDEFFKLLNQIPETDFSEILKNIQTLKTLNLKYLSKVIYSIIKKNAINRINTMTTDDKDLEFAKKVANGEAKGRRKYEKLVNNKEYETLNMYYNLGLKLIPEKNRCTDYIWLGEIK